MRPGSAPRPAMVLVLLAGPGPEGGGALGVSPRPRDARAGEDPADSEGHERVPRLPDTSSRAPDDAFCAPAGEQPSGAGSARSAPEATREAVPEAATLLRAAGSNDVGLLRALLRRGPRAEEARETDANGRVSAVQAPRRLCCWEQRRLLAPGPVPGWGRRVGSVRGHSSPGEARRPACSQHPLSIAAPPSPGVLRSPNAPWGRPPLSAWAPSDCNLARLQGTPRSP